MFARDMMGKTLQELGLECAGRSSVEALARASKFLVLCGLAGALVPAVADQRRRFRPKPDAHKDTRMRRSRMRWRS